MSGPDEMASRRALFLRGKHSQVFPPDPAPNGKLGGRRLAAWCRDRMNGVRPDLHVAGVTYWCSVSSGKARAFWREVVTVPDENDRPRSLEVWRAVSAPDWRLLEMRLACRAGVPVSAVQVWPTFAEENDR